MTRTEEAIAKTAEAKNLAEKEGNRRAVAKGWKIPDGGWQLVQFV